MPSTGTTRRLSLPLSDRDYNDLDLIRSSPEYRGEVDAESDSNAALAIAVFEEGMRVIKERAQANIYAKMVADDEYQHALVKGQDRLRRHGRGQVVDD